VHRVVYEELRLGTVRAEYRAAFQAVIERSVTEAAAPA
jgi:hypothetical protein